MLSKSTLLVVLVSCLVACGKDERATYLNPGEGGGAGEAGQEQAGEPSDGGGSGGEAGNDRGGSAGMAGQELGRGGTSRGGGSSRGGSEDGGTAGAAGNSGEAGSTRAGTAGVSGEAGSSGEAAVDLSPVVTITSPQTPEDPFESPLTGNSADVICKVHAASAPEAFSVDPSSVTIEILNEDGEQVDSPPATATGEPDEYRATFGLAGKPTGAYLLRCTAEDLAEPPNIGSNEVTAYVDRGPNIRVRTPEDDSVWALFGAIPFEFTVEPAELAPGDDLADIRDITLMVAGVSIEFEPHATRPNTYVASVDLTDRELIRQEPTETVGFIITATNRRRPNPVEAQLDYNFKVDGAGPVVTLVSPTSGMIIGGEVTLEFEVQDALSRVDMSSITVELNGQPNTYDPEGRWTTPGNNRVTYTFDSVKVSGSKVQVTVNIEATDTLGNRTSGVSPIFYLDNQPPWVDLDPLDVREATKEQDDWFCSQTFDPVGTNAVGDGQEITETTLIRALVWDVTNHADGPVVPRFAATNQDSVYLYLQPDLNEPLLVDRSGDGFCDDLEVTDLSYRQLAPLTPVGTAHFNALPDPDAFPGVDGECIFKMDPVPEDFVDDPPDHLCLRQSSDMFRVINHVIVGQEPAIYVMDPGGADGLECTGSAWEVSPLIGREGWVCFAARAEDNVGNVGISPPHRLCFDDPDTATVPDCSEPPSCTDGCEPPPHFSPEIIAL